MCRLEVVVVHHAPAAARLGDEAGGDVAGFGHRAHGTTVDELRSRPTPEARGMGRPPAPHRKNRRRSSLSDGDDALRSASRALIRGRARTSDTRNRAPSAYVGRASAPPLCRRCTYATSRGESRASRGRFWRASIHLPPDSSSKTSNPCAAAHLPARRHLELTRGSPGRNRGSSLPAHPGTTGNGLTRRFLRSSSKTAW